MVTILSIKVIGQGGKQFCRTCGVGVRLHPMITAMSNFKDRVDLKL